eukprot:GGOE01040856.1.p1 GENE.GGOE01040856.1~~GGOE01040856.1.p1  ORF type:complete len:227 (+),score=52.09 GGOE01040856.1:48-683(+)
MSAFDGAAPSGAKRTRTPSPPPSSSTSAGGNFEDPPAPSSPSLSASLLAKRQCRGRGSFANTMTSSEGAVVFETLREDVTPAAPEEAAPTEASHTEASGAKGPRAVLHNMPKWVSDSTIESKVGDLGAQVSVRRREDGAVVVTFPSEEDMEQVLCHGPLKFRQSECSWKVLKKKAKEEAPELVSKPKVAASNPEDEMRRLMGFSSFGSSKP